MRTFLAYAAGALLASSAAAQLATGSISDDNVVLAFTGFPTTISSSGGLNDFRVTGAGGADHLYQCSWYWRLDGDAREFAFHNDTASQAPPTSAFAGNRALLVWPNVDNRGIRAVREVEVFSTGPTAGMALERLTVTNNTAAPISINLYAYVDFDQCAAANDSAVAHPTSNKIRVTDASPCAVGEVFAPNADLFEVASWATVRNKLINASPDSLSNAGLPYGPGDFTAAWQWQSRIVAPGAELSVHLVMAQDVSHSGCTRRAATSTFGTAKAGSNGLPAFDAEVPYLGRALDLRIVDGLSGSAPFYVFGITRTSVPVPPFGTILVDPSTAVLFVGSTFNAAHVSVTPLTIPNLPVLCNGGAVMQAYWLDPGAAGSIAHTGGLTWMLGGLN